MSRDQRDTPGFAAGVVTGALVGAGVALLFAPKHGQQLRDEIGQSVTSVREAIARRYRDLAARAGVELDNLQERVDRVVDSVEAGARELVESVARDGSR